MSTEIDRRRLFYAAAALSALGAGAGTVGPALARVRDETQDGPSPLPDRGLDPGVPHDGDYAKVELAKPVVTLGVVQSRVRGVDAATTRTASRTRADNLNHMLDLIDASFGWGGPKDILFFHEFPITGYRASWGRADTLRAAIEIPGEETEAIARKARQYNCWIVFGSYVRDDSWPNHVLSITSVMDNTGTIVDKHWKARNIKGLFGPGFELFTTTIYDVLDEYIERYGLDHVMPVTRTPLGNIVTSSVQREPELMRAFAMKGGEIFLRTATGGFTQADIASTSVHNGVYTAIVNNAISPGNPGFFEDPGNSGGSTIYGPDGAVLAEAGSQFETIVNARLPMAQFRQRHTIPYVHMDLYRPIFDAYRNRFPPNLFADYQPTDTADAARYLANKGVWAMDQR